MFLKYLFYLGVINIVFGFVWKWVVVLPTAILFTFLKIDNAMHLVKVFGAYLIVSLTALLTLSAIKGSSGIMTIIYPLVGGFILFMSHASNAYELRKQAQLNYDFEAIESLKYEGFYMVGAVAFFILTLFLPIIADNSLIDFLLKVIDWIFILPVIGWIVRLGGAMMVIAIIFQGLVVSGVLIGTLVGKVKKSS